MTTRKLFALDLDGTTVDDHSRLGEATKTALLRARAAGHVVAFVTGRRDIDMVNLPQAGEYADYLVLNNGGKIVRTADSAVLQNLLMPPADARKLIEYCLAQDYLLHVVRGLYWGVNKMTQATLSYAKALGVCPVLYRALQETPWQEAEGFMATTEGDKVAAYIDAADLALEYVWSEPTCIDIMGRGITKWGGVAALCDRLGFVPANVIAAGNYYNDIDMLQGAGMGVAVASALDEVKAVADHITCADHNHDAVAELVYHCLPQLAP